MRSATGSASRALSESTADEVARAAELVVEAGERGACRCRPELGERADAVGQRHPGPDGRDEMVDHVGPDRAVRRTAPVGARRITTATRSAPSTPPRP